MNVCEIFEQFGMVVAVLRHAPYILQPLIDECGGDKIKTWARNYSELEKPGRFLLTREGCETTWRQGEIIGAMDISDIAVQSSHQGRGTHTGLCLAEGISVAWDGVWPRFRDLAALNYPLYDYHECVRALRKYGDRAPAMWLNGSLPHLIRSETPQGFRDRVVGHVTGTLRRGRRQGLVIMATHWELATVCSNEFVYHESLGSYSETRFPKYNCGTLIVEDKSGLKGFPFNEKWEILEP